MKRLGLVLFLVCFAVVAGCVETRDEYTINPDGSGKVIFEITFQPMNIGALMGGAAPNIAAGDEQSQLIQSVRDIIEQSSAVEAWTDVSYRMTDDGRVNFKGTAYFPDITKLRIRVAGITTDKGIAFTTGQGEVTVEMKGPQSEAAGTTQTPMPAIPEAQLDEVVSQARTQYNQSRIMMQTMFATLKVETIIHLPGPIRGISNFERLDGTTVRIGLDGAKLMQVVDETMQDAAFLKQMIRGGEDPFSLSGGVSTRQFQKLYGDGGPVRVVAAAAGPLFDYDAEVAVARADYDRLLQELDAEGPGAGAGRITAAEPPSEPMFEPAQPATAGPTMAAGQANVQIGGVRLVRLSDHEQGIMPLGSGRGYTLSLIARLPEPAVRISGGRVERATTDSMQNLLPQRKWDREIRFSVLANDKTTAVFDIQLLLPDKNAAALQEVAGTLEYLTATGAREVDLGPVKFEVGAQAGQLGAVITSIEKDPWKNNPITLSVRFDLRPEQIDSVEFFAEDGTELDFRRYGYESIDGTTTIKFSVGGDIPAQGQIVLKLLEGVRKSTLKFNIADVTLTGQAL